MSKFVLSQIPVNPTFRDSSINTVVVVPLLSQTKADSRSTQSFNELFASLSRHNYTSESTAEGDLVLVVPNSTLTRPGDWRYSDTPLKSFHWQHGCQRLLWHDGRPENSRRAHDKLFGNSSSRNWIDLYPHRRTAAIVGVLNMHDCADADDLQLAIEELHQWAVRYSMPPYQATAHGSSFERDTPVERLFVYDSFDDENQDLDLSQRKLGTSILAFPPSDEAHEQMMDLHMNVVISDLTVAIFRDLEAKIQDSADVFPSSKDTATTMRSAISRYISGNSGGDVTSEEEPVSASSKNLGVGQLAGLVSPESKLAKDSPKHLSSRSSSNMSGGASSNDFSFPSGANNAAISAKTETAEITNHRRNASSKLPQLMTPMDDDLPLTGTSTRDSDVVYRREQARREKYMADLSLLAGSPLDAYERYLKAAESCKTSIDPLWHAMALEGCAAAHIAMAEAGGFSVDEYLENNFQMPEDIMAKAREDPAAKPRQHAKQTLPEIVFELCEEALNIVNRSPTLVYLHTELLLKLALYCSEESEAHLRCRWGEGAYCYAGEPNETPRWERTSVSKLTFNPLSSENMGDMISFNSYIRAKKVCSLLSRAVSMAGIDHATRIDVAIRGAQVCTNGIKATHWPGRKSERVKLYRKAAFFTIVAAEAAAVEGNRDTEDMTRSLWQLATKFYSHQGKEALTEGSYGWAALRAFCLSCVSNQDKSRAALAAAEELLSLLSQLKPSDESDSRQDLSQESEENVSTREKSSKLAANGTGKDSSVIRTAINLEEVDLQHAVASASQFAKSLRSGYAGITSTSPLYAQSKWAQDNPVGALKVPLSDESSLASSLVSLPCAWGSSAKFRSCALAQQQCVDRLVKLQRATSTSSCRPTSAEPGYPLYLISCQPVETEAEDLECVRKRIRTEGAMATFYNPFEAKKSASKNKSVRVPKDEERAISVVFGNRFSLPLDVQRAQVTFKTGQKAVKAAALSFTVPPNTSDFMVHFPFIIKTLDQNDMDEVKRAELFEVAGLSLTCLGKSLFIPMTTITAENLKSNEAQNPMDAKKDTTDEQRNVAEVEVFPCQPNLHVFSSETGSPVQTITVPLSDGELFTVPAFLLTNDLGPSMKASIECLEIFVDGPSATKLFDSTEAAPTDVVDEEEFIRGQMYESSPPPLKIRAVSSNLSLQALNSPADKNKVHCGFAIQITAAHNLGQQIVTDTTSTIVFRYRGPCSSDTEVWRKKTITLRIVHAKGPRLSSFALRPDFTTGCGFSEFTTAMNGKVKEKKASRERTAVNRESGGHELMRLGMDDVSSVCGADCTVILTIANETRSTLTISHPMKLQLGFSTYQVAEMIVHPGVSAKIPLQLKRIARASSPIDEIVSLTSLEWKMHKGNEAGVVKARGRLRVPSVCLDDIISRQPSSLLHLFEAPCTIDLNVGGKIAQHDEVLNVTLGQPVDVAAVVTLHKWIPPELAQDCGISIEFRCVQQNADPNRRRDHVWAGQTRKTSDVDMQNNKYMHEMKLAFCSTGSFLVSCCAKLYQKSGIAAEVWWSEHCMNVKVADLPTQ